MEAASLRRFLSRQDWTFRTADTQDLSHGVHPYPARMVPQLPRALLPQLADAGARVFDPFTGSGTVLVEALAAGMRAEGFDLNPLAYLLATVKTTPMEPGAIAGGMRAIHEAVSPVLRASRSVDAEAVGRRAAEEFGIVHPAEWFPARSLRDLLALSDALDSIADPAIRRLALVALSRTVREASYVRPGSFKLYRRPEEDRARHDVDVAGSFVRALSEVGARVASLAPLGGGERADVRLADARTQDAERHEVLFTSPPYGDSRTTVAYGQFSELSTKILKLDRFFGLSARDVRRLDAALMGGRPNDAPLGSATARATEATIRQTRPDRADSFHWFFADYEAVLARQLSRLRSGGFAVFVVGNRTVARVPVRMDRITEEIGTAFGLEAAGSVARDIPNKVLPARNAPENVVGRAGQTMTRETIVALRK